MNRMTEESTLAMGGHQTIGDEVVNVMRSVWEYYSTQRVAFGNGAIQQLAEILRGMQANRVLLVTDPGITKSGIVDRVTAVLREGGVSVAVYDQAVPEPPVEAALVCCEFARAQQHDDCIIGVGGGSSIDLAKVTALLLQHGGHPRDYFGENRLPGPISPLIAIPTTAGTGSEVTSVAVLTDTEQNLKVGISDNYLRPAVALLDPELTLRLPPYVTACSGIDALAHAVEAYTAKDYRYIADEGKLLFQGAMPISDTLALRAIELIGANLVKAVHQGSNLEARTNMMLGSLLAGMAFSNAGTAAAHALAYPIGGLVKSPHGEVTGLLLPYVMKFNASAEPEKMEKVAEALGVNVSVLNKADRQAAASVAVTELIEQIGLPTRLSQIGIQHTDTLLIAEKAVEISRLVRNNPRTPTKESFAQMLALAL